MSRNLHRKIGLSFLLSAWLCNTAATAGDADAPAGAQGPPGRYALEFDGETSFVWLGQAVPDELDNGTVEVWFQLDEPWQNGAQMPLVGDDAGGLNLVLRSNRLAFNKDGGGSKELSWPPGRLSAGWHHAAGVWGEGGMKLFADGKLVASHPDDQKPYKRSTLPYDTVPVETRLGLARIWWGNQRYFRFSGRMAFVRISRKRLYEEDFTPRIDPPAQPGSDVLRYDFSEGRGHVLKDSSGHGRDALIAGCSWTELKTAPRLAGDVIEPPDLPGPSEAPVVVLPFTCHPEMEADANELEGFHLTTAWLLNSLGGLPVTTEDRCIGLAPPAAPPYRGQFPDYVLSRVRGLASARAVVHGYIKQAPGRKSDGRSAPARLTLRVLQPGADIWKVTIPVESQSLAGYARAQRAVARAVFDHLAPKDRKGALSALDEDKVPDQVRELWDRAKDRIKEHDTFALLRATAEAAEAVRTGPRRPESWRVLAESYAWLGGSPSKTYTSGAHSALSRARAAHNIALMLSEPTPETTLTGALIDRFVPDYLGARSSALRLLNSDHDWTPEQQMVLALTLGEARRMPATVPGRPALEPLVLGRILELNGKSPKALDSFEIAWQRNPRTSSAPVLIADSEAGSGLGILRLTASRAVAPGLTQAGRILAWEGARQSEPVGEFLRLLAQSSGQPEPDLGDNAHDPEAVDRAALKAAGDEPLVGGQLALDRVEVLMEFARRLVSDQDKKTRGILLPGQAPAPDTSLAVRTARAEAESGYHVLLRLLVVMLGVPDESFDLLRPLVLSCGYDTMTTHWAEKFMARNKSAYKGKLPWPPGLGRSDLLFAPGYVDMIYAEPTYKANVYRDARRRFPFWDLPLSVEQKPSAYSRNPYDEANIRLWVAQKHGQDRLNRLQRVQADTPESNAARRVAAEVWLRDPVIGDERKGLEILKALVAEDPDAPEPYLELGAYLLESGKPDEAVRWYEKLAERPLASLVPTSALRRIASIERARHQPDRERAVLEQAAQSFQGTVVHRYARALAEAGEIEKATALFEAGRQRYAPGAGFLASEAAALFRAGRKDQARKLITDFVRAQPYRDGSLAAVNYFRETEDAREIAHVPGKLGFGRAGRLVLARAYLKLDRPKEALDAARSAKKLGHISNADQYADPIEAAELLARASGALYVNLRSAEKPDKARALLENFARKEGLTHLAALLAPVAAGHAPWVREALTVLSEAAKPDDPALPAARALSGCPRLGETLRDQLARESQHRFGPDNRLRMAVLEVLRLDLMPADKARTLASALMGLNPNSTWVSQQAAVFQQAFGEGEQGRATFLKRAEDLDFSEEVTRVYQTAADSWPDWHLLGPFPDDRLDGLRRPYLDETKPIDLKSAVTSGKTDRRWVRPRSGHSWGGLALAAELVPTDEPSVFYAYREIEVHDEGPSQFVLEGPQSARVFLNGQEQALWVKSPGIADRLVLALPLKPGKNRLLLKLRYPGRGFSSQPLFARSGVSADGSPTGSKPAKREKDD